MTQRVSTAALTPRAQRAVHPLKLISAAWRIRRRKPTFISFNVTNRCAQRCPMCSVWRQPAEELSLPEIARIFTNLRQAGLAVVEVSGGEPFLRPDIFDILHSFDDLGLMYSVNTNGTLITRDVLLGLANCRGLLQLAISLDSLDAERYARLRGSDSLPRVLESLDLIAEFAPRFPVKLNVTMSRVNHDEVLHILDFAKNRGFGVSVFPVVQGASFAHRAECELMQASEAERLEMSTLFRELARLRRSGEPLWEYSGYYEVAADYVLGRPIGRCDAGRTFLDLRANGDLAACVDLPAFASLRREPATNAMVRLAGERERVDACSRTTPCCYTCTANVSETGLHPFRFSLEEALIWLRARRHGERSA